MDGRGWLAAVYVITQSQTRLKQLSSSSSNSLPGQADSADLQVTLRTTEV